MENSSYSVFFVECMFTDSSPETSQRLLPPLELAVMRSLWSLEKATVAEVKQAMATERNLAYTTVLTLLDRLTRKGAVSRRKQGRSFVYNPLLARRSEREQAVRRLVEEHFDGSQRELRTYLDSEVKTDNVTPRFESEPIDSTLL